VPRPSSFRAALAGLLTVGAALAGAQVPAGAAAAAEVDPLIVHIDSISPSVPRDGDVEITGTVTNASPDVFTRINLHAFASQTPIPDATQLAASAAVDPAESVGERVTVPGTFDTVDILAPGESATFSDSVPVELLGIPDEAGVYWIGIHALGDGAVPRDTIADGRARTFIPAEPRGNRTQEASVVLSLRSRVWFDDDGRVAGLDRWARRLAEGGSLDGALDVAESAGAAPYTWLVDPAVLFAINRIALGNPARSIAPDPNVAGQEPTPTETPTDGEGTESPATIVPPPSESGHAASDEEEELAATANAWLQRLRTLMGTTPMLTLPFGDLDVSAAVRNDRTRYDQAVARSTEVMAALSLPSQPAVAPTTDRLSPEAIEQTPDGTVILLGDNAFTLPPSSPSSVVRLLGHKVVVTSTGAETGGPLPTDPHDPLALRQRLLSEAALRLLAGDAGPLVVTLPTVWRGEDAAAFFDGLDQPWLDLVPVAAVAARQAVGVPAADLVYTEADMDAELDAGSFTATVRATNAATLMEQVLLLQTTIESQVQYEVLVTLSEQHRGRPHLGLRAARRIEEALRGDLATIEVDAPKRVTLSSDSGPLGVTLVNGLDQPVTVQVRPTTDGQLTLTGDSVRTLGPRSRSALRYEASTDQPGVHMVRLAVTSLDGVPLGSTDELPIRAARVSALIWIVMAIGGVVLFGMIGYRLPGQIRARRAELAAGTDPEHPVAPADPLVPERP
jgi:hypothetical protein